MNEKNSFLPPSAPSLDAVASTAAFLGFDMDSVIDIAIGNPRLFGVIVDATVIRLTNESKSNG